MFGSNKFLKKDPLVEAVQAAMQDGETRRQAIAVVNEAFGVYNRNAVVREDLAAYDAAIEEVYADLKEGKRHSQYPIMDKNTDPLKNKRNVKASRRSEIEKTFPPSYAKKKNEKEGNSPKDEIRASLGKHKKPGHLPEAKLADKDYDKDGKIESPKDEVWGSRFRAAKMAGKMEEEKSFNEMTPSEKMQWMKDQVQKGKDEKKRLRKSLREKPKKTVKEETQIDERNLLKRMKDTMRLGSSGKERVDRISGALSDRGGNWDFKKGDFTEKGKSQVKSRLKNVKGASDYALREEEQIDEISKKLAARYGEKAQREIDTVRVYGGPRDTETHNKMKRRGEGVRLAKAKIQAPRVPATEETQIDEMAHEALTAAGYKAGPKDSTTGFGRTYTKGKKSVYVDADEFAHHGSGSKATVTYGNKETSAYLNRGKKKMEEEQLDEINARKQAKYDKIVDAFKNAPGQVGGQSRAERNFAIRKHMKDNVHSGEINRAIKRHVSQEFKSKIQEAAYSAKAGRAERYESEERGKKVAGAILKRIRAKHMKEEQSFEAALGEQSMVGATSLAPGKTATAGRKLASVPLLTRRPSSFGVSAAPKDVASAARPASTTGTGSSATTAAATGAATPSTSAKPSGYSNIVSGAVNPTAAKTAMDTAIARSAAVRSTGANAATPAATAPAPTKAAPTPTSTVQTKGGAFPVFSKGSEAAAEFRKAYAGAAPGSTFKWKASGETGREREYKAAPAAEKPAATPASAPATTAATPAATAPAPTKAAPDETSTQKFLSQNLGDRKSTPAGPEAPVSGTDPGSQENIKRRSGAALEESVQIGDYKYRIV